MSDSVKRKCADSGFESDSDDVASAGHHDGGSDRDVAAVKSLDATAAGLCSRDECVVGRAVGDLRGALQRATPGSVPPKSPE